MATKKQINFGVALIRFYKSFLVGTSEAVSELAKIEKEYPSEYKVLRQLKDDPEIVVKLSEKLPPAVKDALFSVFVQASALGGKASRLFDLSVSEKETLAKEMVTFSDEVDRILTGLIEKPKGKVKEKRKR